MVELVAICEGAAPEENGIPTDALAAVNFRLQVEYYSRIGFRPPWIGYLAKMDGAPVGMGSFKGAPKDNRVEVAYFTFPEHEGKGVATDICRALVRTALAENPRVEVVARTLPEKNASTRVLAKSGFVFVSAVQDPEDGEVWEWMHSPR